MDGQLVTLGSAPAHVVPGGRRLNAAAAAGIQSSFAVLKIRGKVWRIRHRGEEIAIEESLGTGRDGRPLPKMPVPTIDVVVVGTSHAISKRWYQSGYDATEGKAPDCFSVNGISPDPASAHKQSPMCATCPKNIWGSATMENGSKAKACRDGKRIAVVPSVDISNEVFDGPMLLDIPPTSLKIWKSYVDLLERMGADLAQVVTRIGFSSQETLQLEFSCAGWVQDAADYQLADEMTQSEAVRRMLHEATVEATADAEAHAAAIPGPRPAHIQALAAPRQTPAQAVETAQPVASPVVETAAPETMVAVAQAVTQERRASPFATARAQTAAPSTPAAQATPAPAKAAPSNPAPTIVQGAPASLEAEIDNLLNNAC